MLQLVSHIFAATLITHIFAATNYNTHIFAATNYNTHIFAATLVDTNIFVSPTHTFEAAVVGHRTFAFGRPHPWGL